MVPGSPEIAIAFDRDKLGVLGLDQDLVAATVRTKVGGSVPARYRDGERHLDIRVRGQADQRTTLAAVRDLVVAERDGKTVPLATVATLTESRGPAEIHRIGADGSASSAPISPAATSPPSTPRSTARLRGLVLPAGTTAQLGGQNREMERSFRSLQLAVLLAVFLVYLVMASQFESLVIPDHHGDRAPGPGRGGLRPGHLGRPLSVFAVIGAIMLAGIVVNNGIVLVDRMNQLRRAGREAVAPRARPAARALRPSS